jgi:hypothetical protein
LVHRRNGRKRIGVSRTRSAAARRWRGDKLRRQWLRAKRAAVLREQARAGSATARVRLIDAMVEAARMMRARVVR